jgi:hypothetical protein
MPRLEPLRSLGSSDSLMHELENRFEGTSDEEREAAEVVAGAIAGRRQCQR